MKKTPVETSLSGATEVISDACASCTDHYAEQIRRAPLASVLCAAAFGYFLQFLPLSRIITGLIRLFIYLIQPAVFLFGGYKLVSLLMRECEKSPGEEKKTKKSARN